jgi:PRTRC genetic system protein A
MMDRFLATDCPVITMPHERGAFTPLAVPGHRLIVAADGMYKEIRRTWLHAIVRLADVSMPFGEIQESFTMPFRLKESLFLQFLEQAKQAAPMETAAWIVWNETSNDLRLVQMEYSYVSSVLLKINRPVLEVGEHLIVDLHSHHVMSAGFSRTDDEDDIASNEVKLAGVVGTIDQTPTWNFRLCLEGVLMPGGTSLLKIKELS